MYDMQILNGNLLAEIVIEKGMNSANIFLASEGMEKGKYNFNWED